MKHFIPYINEDIKKILEIKYQASSTITKNLANDCHQTTNNDTVSLHKSEKFDDAFTKDTSKNNQSVAITVAEQQHGNDDSVNPNNDVFSSLVNTLTPMIDWTALFELQNRHITNNQKKLKAKRTELKELKCLETYFNSNKPAIYQLQAELCDLANVQKTELDFSKQLVKMTNIPEYELEISQTGQPKQKRKMSASNKRKQKIAKVSFAF